MLETEYTCLDGGNRDRLAAHAGLRDESWIHERAHLAFALCDEIWLNILAVSRGINLQMELAFHWQWRNLDVIDCFFFGRLLALFVLQRLLLLNEYEQPFKYKRSLPAGSQAF